MRIISGIFRGRKLVESRHLKASLRPTTDMAREALFNILFSAKSLRETGFNITGCNILDVCCGTGAVAFEALSRGAESAFLIDNNRAHLEVVKENIAAFKLEDEVKILQADAKNLMRNEKFFDLVFIDPPYRDSYFPIVKSLIDQNWIQKNSLVVIEFQTNIGIAGVDDVLRKLDERSYGGTSFGFFVVNRESVPTAD
jgi:16S rRNA (guanine966-N2)-methyltransferase